MYTHYHGTSNTLHFTCTTIYSSEKDETMQVSPPIVVKYYSRYKEPVSIPAGWPQVKEKWAITGWIHYPVTEKIWFTLAAGANDFQIAVKDSEGEIVDSINLNWETRLQELSVSASCPAISFKYLVREHGSGPAQQPSVKLHRFQVIFESDKIWDGIVAILQKSGFKIKQARTQSISPTSTLGSASKQASDEVLDTQVTDSQVVQLPATPVSIKNLCTRPAAPFGSTRNISAINSLGNHTAFDISRFLEQWNSQEQLSTKSVSSFRDAQNIPNLAQSTQHQELLNITSNFNQLARSQNESVMGSTILSNTEQLPKYIKPKISNKDDSLNVTRSETIDLEANRHPSKAKLHPSKEKVLACSMAKLTEPQSIINETSSNQLLSINDVESSSISAGRIKSFSSCTKLENSTAAPSAVAKMQIPLTQNSPGKNKPQENLLPAEKSKEIKLSKKIIKTKLRDKKFMKWVNKVETILVSMESKHKIPNKTI